MAPSNPTYCDAPETEFGKPATDDDVPSTPQDKKVCSGDTDLSHLHRKRPRETDGAEDGENKFVSTPPSASLSAVETSPVVPLRPMAPSNPTYCDAPGTEFGKPDTPPTPQDEKVCSGDIDLSRIPHKRRKDTDGADSIEHKFMSTPPDRKCAWCRSIVMEGQGRLTDCLVLGTSYYQESIFFCESCHTCLFGPGSPEKWCFV